MDWQREHNMAVQQIEIEIPQDVFLQLRERVTADDAQELAKFCDCVWRQADVSWAGIRGAGGEAMENDAEVIISEWLEFNSKWCLHAALIGHRILIRAGYLWDGCCDERDGEHVGDGDVQWILQDNSNEVWAHIFRDQIDSTLRLKKGKRCICQVSFKVASE